MTTLKPGDKAPEIHGTDENGYKDRVQVLDGEQRTAPGPLSFALVREAFQHEYARRAAASGRRITVTAPCDDGRLLAVSENYPDLKSNQNFLALQSQLEGTENRIAVARKRYIDRVAEYNKMVRFFPTNLTAKFLLHLDEKPNFRVADEKAVAKPPEVKF